MSVLFCRRANITCELQLYMCMIDVSNEIISAYHPQEFENYYGEKAIYT